MNLVCKVLAISVIFVSFATAQESFPASKKGDSWLSRDKIEHFSFSLFCAVATAKTANRHFELRKEKSLALGVGVSFSLGVFKEGIDFQTKKGTASKKDLVWDIAGTLTGVLIAGLTL